MKILDLLLEMNAEKEVFHNTERVGDSNHNSRTFAEQGIISGSARSFVLLNIIYKISQFENGYRQVFCSI